MRALLLAAVLLGPAAAARAEPVTYQGTLGTAAIVVEFSRDPAGGMNGIAGRYFYRKAGADIPLRAGKGGRLVEEGACTPEKCPETGPGPDAATWTLTTEDGGARLQGTWKDGKRSLPVTLERVGPRPADEAAAETPQALLAHSEELGWGDAPITPEAEPYDALRIQAPFREEAGGSEAGGTFTYAIDPRTKFRFPRVASLADGTNPAKGNAALALRQGRHSLSALLCLAKQYPSFGEPGTTRFEGEGTLGGYDTDFTTGVTALAGHLLSWTESGSLYCGGAHPYNFTVSQTLDVASGRMLETGDLVRDFAGNAPGPKLAAFVRERRPKPETADDKSYDAECGIDALIGENLAARLGRDAGGGATLVFALQGLPHAIAACEGDLFSLPLAEAKAWMKPDAYALAGGR